MCFLQCSNHFTTLGRSTPFGGFLPFMVAIAWVNMPVLSPLPRAADVST